MADCWICRRFTCNVLVEPISNYFQFVITFTHASATVLTGRKVIEDVAGVNMHELAAPRGSIDFASASAPLSPAGKTVCIEFS